MPRLDHATTDQAYVDAVEAFIIGCSELTLTARDCVPVALLCGDAGAMLPFGGIAPNGGLGLS